MLTQEALKIKKLVSDVKPENWPVLEPPTIQLIAGMYPKIFEQEFLFSDPATNIVVKRMVIPQLSQADLIAGLKANKVMK